MLTQYAQYVYCGCCSLTSDVEEKPQLQVFTASPIDVVAFKFREMLPTGNRRNLALLI